jgi:hypothetical protein
MKANEKGATFSFRLFFDLEPGRDMFFRNVCWLTFNLLHGVVAQKIELFITIAVRASNST